MYTHIYYLLLHEVFFCSFCSYVLETRSRRKRRPLIIPQGKFDYVFEGDCFILPHLKKNSVQEIFSPFVPAEEEGSHPRYLSWKDVVPQLSS